MLQIYDEYYDQIHFEFRVTLFTKYSIIFIFNHTINVGSCLTFIED